MKTKLYLIGFLLAFLSSCGVITKARYGNGFKLNIGLNSLQKEDAVRQEKKVRARRIVSDEKKQPAPDTLEHLSYNGNNTGPADIGANRRPAIGSVERKFGPVRKLLNRVHTGIKAMTVMKGDNYRPVEPNVKLAGVLFY